MKFNPSLILTFERVLWQSRPPQRRCSWEGCDHIQSKMSWIQRTAQDSHCGMRAMWESSFALAPRERRLSLGGNGPGLRQNKLQSCSASSGSKRKEAEYCLHYVDHFSHTQKIPNIAYQRGSQSICYRRRPTHVSLRATLYFIRRERKRKKTGEERNSPFPLESTTGKGW